MVTAPESTSDFPSRVRGALIGAGWKSLSAWARDRGYSVHTVWAVVNQRRTNGPKSQRILKEVVRDAKI